MLSDQFKLDTMGGQGDVSPKKFDTIDKGATPGETKATPTPHAYIEDQEDDEDFFEPLSYKKLMRTIESLHPV